MTAGTMTPVHFAIRDDQAAGAALRRVVEALPANHYLNLIFVSGRWTATAGPPIGSDERVRHERADTATEALTKLVEALT